MTTASAALPLCTSAAQALAPTFAAALQLPVDLPTLTKWVAVYVVIAWVPVLLPLGRFSGRRRLARAYPAAPPAGGTRIRYGFAIIGSSRYRNIVRMTVDDRFLHVSAIPLFRPATRRSAYPSPTLSRRRTHTRGSRGSRSSG